MKNIFLTAVGTVVVCGCASVADEVVITEIEPSALPASVVSAIASERAGFEIDDVQKKVRGERVYYDVEGKLSDGSDLEFDILMDGDGANIVEIQRDLAWQDVPNEVQAVALTASENVVPVRTIESVQTDGSVIYELFAEGKPADPSYEVRVFGGEVELLTERWIH